MRYEPLDDGQFALISNQIDSNFLFFAPILQNPFSNYQHLVSRENWMRIFANAQCSQEANLYIKKIKIFIIVYLKKLFFYLNKKKTKHSPLVYVSDTSAASLCFSIAAFFSKSPWYATFDMCIVFCFIRNVSGSSATFLHPECRICCKSTQLVFPSLSILCIHQQLCTIAYYWFSPNSLQRA